MSAIWIIYLIIGACCFPHFYRKARLLIGDPLGESGDFFDWVLWRVLSFILALAGCCLWPIVVIISIAEAYWKKHYKS